MLRRLKGMRVAVVLLAFLAFAAPAAAKLPPLPHGWPKTLQLGLTDSPGGAAALRKSAPFGFRYQYLAGGVNTGQGWSTWNPGGSFASMYVRDSWAHGVIPVLTYYMLLQSNPHGGDEAQTDLSHLRDAQLMQAYWQDVRLMFQRIRGTKPVVVHVEPDLWGYIEQANAVALGSAFAQQWVTLRDSLAPNVILAYHMSGFGTKHDIVYEDPPDATVRAYATESAKFYLALHAKFDVSFEDYSDRDAGFYEKVQGNAKTWFTPADFHRHLLYGATFVKLAGRADGRLADPAREHADERDGQHLGPLPGQPRPVAPRRLGPRAPPRVRERRLRGVPVRRRRGRNHLRLRRPARRRHEPAADQRQHASVAHRRRRRRLLPRAGARVLQGGALKLPG